MTYNERPTIAIIGSRGIPAAYGGFETFAEEISTHLVNSHGFGVTVVCDADQRARNNGMAQYKAVSLRYSPYAKGKNAIRYYYDSVRRVVEDHDIIYSCGPAGGLFGWLAHYHGKIMMTNPDGLNSQRSKWNRIAKLGFQVFERAACIFSDRVICDAVGIERYIQGKYGCKNTDIAEYGAYPNPYIHNSRTDTDIVEQALSEYGVAAGGYHLVVSRLEPENNLEMIIRGYQARERRWPLLVVGNLNPSTFVSKLRAMANAQVHFVGGIYNKNTLAIVRANSRSYLHGHSVGGTNPSLLEAMGSRNLCVCHDNPFNREVVREWGLYFADAGEVDACLIAIENNINNYDDLKGGALQRVMDYYTWDNMADKYRGIFMAAYQKRLRGAERGSH